MVWIIEVLDFFDQRRLFYLHKSTTFGRGTRVDLSLPDLDISVSRWHLSFDLHPPGEPDDHRFSAIEFDNATRLTYIDVGSKSGTVLNKMEKLVPGVDRDAQHGDELLVGEKDRIRLLQWRYNICISAFEKFSVLEQHKLTTCTQHPLVTVHNRVQEGCSFLVMGTFACTFKALTAIVRHIHIITVEWLCFVLNEKRKCLNTYFEMPPLTEYVKYLV